MTQRETPSSSGRAWWQGTRGEWYVVAQFVMMALVLVGPRADAGEWVARVMPRIVSNAVAVGLLVSGGFMMLLGLFRLGPALTALPYPRDDGALIETGPFAIVRHPIYTGLVGFGAGWALLVDNWLTLVYVAGLLLVLDVKSRREERWLAQKYPAYEAYRRRVRKLIPFLY
jgi:protein-S-isoprenylcysteine O-methyltransferase Ste14